MKLSVALIVKNEKDHIEDVLKSVSGADEIIVCDTGSNDNTVELARKYTPHVFTDYVWQDHFADARNHALSKCTGDWVLSIDADETLEAGGIEKIRKLIKNATVNTFSVKMISKDFPSNVHYLPRILRRTTCSWKGQAHETITPVEQNYCDVEITYGYSTAHNLDPDRMLRILKKAVRDNPASARDLYYLAREWWYRKDFKQALELFKQAAKCSKWPPEKADAYIYIARCYHALGRTDKAKEACLQAIGVNPDSREALLLMASYHVDPERTKWIQFAEQATNQNVLFRRVPTVTTSKIPKKLHHIWVGPKNPPLKWMQTWRDKNPDWKYKLWDNDAVFGRTWINQKHVDYYREREIWHGVADVVRYEILAEEGGFMPGADSECLLPFGDLFDDGFESYAVYENEKVRPGLIAPLYASQPNSRFVRLLVEGLYVKEEVGEPWKTTGNLYMQQMVARYMPPVKILPSHTFIPTHHTGETYIGNGKVYATQLWGTTKNLYE